MSPLSSKIPSRLESCSEAATMNSDAGTSIAPITSMRSDSTASSGVGSRISTLPSTAMIRSGSAITMPSWAVISVGLPQPICTTGPNTVLPSLSGNHTSRPASTASASSSMSSGNRIESIAPVRRSAASASTSIVRCSASSPPTPISVKPKLSGIGSGKTRPMLPNSAQPSPLGSSVSTITIALSPRPKMSSASPPT